MTDQNKNRRVFERHNGDGSINTIVMEWEKEKPTSTFKMDVNGYEGANCLSELGDVEKLIGLASVEEKPEFYASDDPQDVFIVGKQ